MTQISDICWKTTVSDAHINLTKLVVRVDSHLALCYTSPFWCCPSLINYLNISHSILTYSPGNCYLIIHFVFICLRKVFCHV